MVRRPSPPRRCAAAAAAGAAAGTRRLVSAPAADRSPGCGPRRPPSIPRRSCATSPPGTGRTVGWLPPPVPRFAGAAPAVLRGEADGGGEGVVPVDALGWRPRSALTAGILARGAGSEGREGGAPPAVWRARSAPPPIGDESLGRAGAAPSDGAADGREAAGAVRRRGAWGAPRPLGSEGLPAARSATPAPGRPPREALAAPGAAREEAPKALPVFRWMAAGAERAPCPRSGRSRAASIRPDRPWPRTSASGHTLGRKSTTSPRKTIPTAGGCARGSWRGVRERAMASLLVARGGAVLQMGLSRRGGSKRHFGGRRVVRAGSSPRTPSVRMTCHQQSGTLEEPRG